MIDLALRIVVFLFGLTMVIATVRSAIVTFVLPRVGRSWITRRVFLTMRILFNIVALRFRHYASRDGIMALYAPVTLLQLTVTWLGLALLGFMCMFWAIGVPTWEAAFSLSGSSLLTLGFSAANSFPSLILAFAEAMTGLILLAVLISYLPTMYSAFSKRETLVTLLEVRAGSPPSAVEMFERFYRLHSFEKLNDVWKQWEVWFAELDETHTSLAALVFYRSPKPQYSWLTSAGAVLDAASLAASTLDIPKDTQADLCIRAGYLALRHIADYFRLPYNTNPKRGDPISVTKEEFDAAYDRLLKYGIALKPNRQQCWEDFAGWRVNYDMVLRGLAVLTMAPPGAMWSTDRVPDQTIIPARAFRGFIMPEELPEK
jgi:hypothetical protein